MEGYVALELSSPQNTKGISIVISGKARVKWTGRLTRTNEPGNPCGTEIVLSTISRQLLGNGRDSQWLATGRHELPFSFQLPTGLPLSFYCNVVADFCWNVTSKGYIRYSLTATMVRSWKANLNATRDIQIKDIVKTNTTVIDSVVSPKSKREQLFLLW